MKLLSQMFFSAILTAGILAACGGKTPIPTDPMSPEEPPSTHPTVGEPGGEPAPSGEPVPEPADQDELSPGACEATGGTCAPESCETRGQVEAAGTCYLNGEPQTNLNCCSG